MKVELLTETLSTLNDSKISAFFSYVRMNEDMLPTDGTLKKILTSNYKMFSNYLPEAKQIENTGELPSKEWVHEFWERAIKVVDGGMSSTQLKEEMGI